MGTSGKRPSQGFVRCTQGASAVEFALVLPVLVFLLLGGIELANAYFLRSQMIETTRDAARRAAVGSLPLDRVPGFVRAQLAAATDAEVHVTVAEGSSEFGQDITVKSAVPLADLLPFTSSRSSVDTAQPPPSEGGTQQQPATKRTDTTDSGTDAKRAALSVSVTMLRER